jgi:SagB-type dehydrogenase family enzyme
LDDARNELERARYFLKDSVRKEINFMKTDQSRGIPSFPIQKPIEEDTKIIELKKLHDWSIVYKISLASAIEKRVSRRAFRDIPLSLKELSFLLWATQGIKDARKPYFRTVPSAGARHSFETYLSIRNITGIEEGLYLYRPIEHAIAQLKVEKDHSKRAAAACFNQSFIGDSSVVFIWTSIPYRVEWRYDLAAHRVIAFDIGHVCQNLYLACEAIGAGTCGIGAYDQEQVDSLIEVDGENEFTVYLAPIGKI